MPNPSRSRPALASRAPARPRAGGSPLLRLRGPVDLVHAVPYLIGFHPRDSLVLVGLADGELVVTARLDLADVDPAGSPGGAVAHTVGALRRGGAVELVALFVTDRTRGGDPAAWQAEVASVLRAADSVGCDVFDALLVGAACWWSLLCSDPGCCPPGGTPLAPAEASEVAATATYAGLVALPDRTALAAQLQPRPEAQRAVLLPDLVAAERAEPGREPAARRSVTRALFAAARAGNVGSDETRVRFGAALRELAVRDAVWLAVDDQRLDGRGLWRDLALRLPSPYDAASLFLFGWASWRHGDGALAGIAAERAVESDPGYSAADLLLAAVRGGVDPRRLPRLRSRRGGA